MRNFLRCLTGILLIALLLRTGMAAAIEQPHSSGKQTAAGNAAPPSAAEKPLPEIVAKVGTETISGAEFKYALEQRALLYSSAGRSIPDQVRFRKETLEKLIHERMVYLLATNAGISVPAEEIDKELSLYKANLGGETAYKTFREKSGLSDENILEIIRRRLLTEKFVQEKTKDLSVSEEQMRQAYEAGKNKGRFMRKTPTTDFENILAYAPLDDTAAMEVAHQKIIAIRQRVVGGESFEDIAKKESDDTFSAERGGLYQEVVPRQVMAEVGDMVSQLKAGEISEPFKTKRGWHIIKLLEQNAPGEIPFEKVKERIQAELLRPQRDEIMQKLIESIRMIVQVEIYENPAKPAQTQ